jgi:hypothetical protein
VSIAINAQGDADASAPSVGFSNPTNNATVSGTLSVRVAATVNVACLLS